jgi:hypothetical protein
MGKFISKDWFSRNYRTLIISAFLVPIFTVALVSISHVTKWYGISNPVSWAIYLSIGIEIAALSTLAAISADMGKKVYFPFGLVTLVQFIGNIYFAYSYIDIDSKSFKDWIDLVSPMVEFMGVDNTDLIGHKRFLAFFAGGMLPIISLSFLHMLVKFTEEDRKKQSLPQPVVDVEKISREAAIIEAERERNEKYTPTEEELEKIEKILNKKNNNLDQKNEEKVNYNKDDIEHENYSHNKDYQEIEENDNESINNSGKYDSIDDEQINKTSEEKKNDIIVSENENKIEEYKNYETVNNKEDLIKNESNQNTVEQIDNQYIEGEVVKEESEESIVNKHHKEEVVKEEVTQPIFNEHHQIIDQKEIVKEEVTQPIGNEHVEEKIIEKENIIEETILTKPEDDNKDIAQEFSTIESEFENNSQEFSTIESEKENIFQKEDDFDGFVPEPFATEEDIEQIEELKKKEIEDQIQVLDSQISSDEESSTINENSKDHYSYTIGQNLVNEELISKNSNVSKKVSRNVGNSQRRRIR